MSAEDFLNPPDLYEGPEIGEKREMVLEVYTCNWKAVHIFQACTFRQQVLVGMKGGFVIPEGVDATEMLAACELYGIPQEERPLLLEQVRLMSDAACRYLAQK